MSSLTVFNQNIVGFKERHLRSIILNQKIKQNSSNINNYNVLPRFTISVFYDPAELHNARDCFMPLCYEECENQRQGVKRKTSFLLLKINFYVMQLSGEMHFSNIKPK